jgi:hypothetical protein
MKSSFALSLGIAAIDGLTCAFVAMLVLALVLIGSGETTQAPDWTSSGILLIQKMDDNTAATQMTMLLLVDVQAGPGKDAPSDVKLNSDGTLQPLPHLSPAVEAARGGRVSWADHTCSESRICSAELFVTRPRQPTGWRVRLRIADTSGSLADDFPQSLSLSIHVAGNPADLKKSLKFGEDLEVCPDWKQKTVTVCT